MTLVTGEGLGRRERKKLATRAALSEAALRLAVAHGVDHVTVERIADEADVALRTFFNHFSSKEEAVVAGDVGTTGSLADAFDERPDDEPLVESLREAALAVVRGEVFRDRERVEQMRAVRRSPALLPYQLAAFAAQERALAAGVARRTGSDLEVDLYPALVAASVMAGLRLAVQRWVSNPEQTFERPHLLELVETAFAQLTVGLAGPPPR